MPQLFETSVKIGEFVFKAQSPFPISLDIGYSSFIVNNNDKPNVTLQVEELTQEHIGTPHFIFEAVEQNIPLWKVSESAHGYKLFLYNQMQNGRIQSVIDIPHNSNTWRVYCALDNQSNISPFAYPAGPLLLYMLAIQNQAFMQHASSIISNGKAFVFSGFSGIGKSTMASIWQEQGYTLINDDRILIQKVSEQFKVYNTPMFYKDEPKQAPLAGIFLLQQSPQNYIKKLQGVTAITNFMRFSIQHAYSKQFLNTHLQLAQEIYKTVPIFELGFIPDQNIIDFIHSHT